MTVYPFKKFSLIVLTILLAGCGYRAVGTAPSDRALSVTIPLIRDDEDGVLRNALAQSLSETGKYVYTSYDAPYELIVKIEKNVTDTTGYAWDVDPSTGLTVNRLYPSEGRKVVGALVTLQNSKTKEALLEPFRVSAQANYDFVNPTAVKDIEYIGLDGKKGTVLQYSLGQLDSEEGAKGEVQHPIFKELAYKIGEAIVRAAPHEKKK